MPRFSAPKTRKRTPTPPRYKTRKNRSPDFVTRMASTIFDPFLPNNYRFVRRSRSPTRKRRKRSNRETRKRIRRVKRVCERLCRQRSLTPTPPTPPTPQTPPGFKKRESQPYSYKNVNSSKPKPKRRNYNNNNDDDEDFMFNRDKPKMNRERKPNNYSKKGDGTKFNPNPNRNKKKTPPPQKKKTPPPPKNNNKKFSPLLKKNENGNIRNVTSETMTEDDAKVILKLNFPGKVDFKTLKKAYRKRAIKIHPAKHKDSIEAKEKWFQVQNAYDKLCKVYKYPCKEGF